MAALSLVCARQTALCPSLDSITAAESKHVWSDADWMKSRAATKHLHGYLEEGAEGRPDDPWWLTAAREPSGIVSVEPKKLRGRFQVNASVRVGADDRAGRAQLVRYAARPPFADVSGHRDPRDSGRLLARLRIWSGDPALDPSSSFSGPLRGVRGEPGKL